MFMCTEFYLYSVLLLFVLSGLTLESTKLKINKNFLTEKSIQKYMTFPLSEIAETFEKHPVS